MRPAAVAGYARPVLCCRHCAHEFPQAVWQHLPLAEIEAAPCLICKRDEAGALRVRCGEPPSPEVIARTELERIAAL
jgi:hypothetical protein